MKRTFVLLTLGATLALVGCQQAETGPAPTTNEPLAPQIEQNREIPPGAKAQANEQFNKVPQSMRDQIPGGSNPNPGR